jgi:hypothetical protein
LLVAVAKHELLMFSVIKFHLPDAKLEQIRTLKNRIKKRTLKNKVSYAMEFLQKCRV